MIDRADPKMRILIDTRYLPCPPLEAETPNAVPAPASAPTSARALVIAFIRAAVDHEIHLWLPADAPERLCRARLAWQTLLPPGRIHAAPSLADAGACDWRRAAASRLEAAAIAELAPGLFWLPMAADAGPSDLPAEPPPPLAAIPCLATNPPPPEPAAPLHGQVEDRPRLARAWQWLKSAGALWVEDPAAARVLTETLLLAPARARAFAATSPVLRAEELRAVPPPAPAVPAGRPTLAYLSPLPPERSGIADYSAELLPELATHYAITLVGAGPPLTDPWLRANFPVIDVAAFRAQAHRFERILYHLGNSEYHAQMPGLLDEHPGVMVLHDFYLGHLHAWRQSLGGEPGALVQALLDAHGWPALRLLAHDGVEAALWRYPGNRALFAAANGVIVHSDHAIALARDWLAPEFVSRMRHVPHLRRPLPPPDRARARAALGLDAQDFLVCSFGFLGPSKCNHALLDAWFESPLGQRADCRLVFVGQNPDNDEGYAIARRLSAWRGAAPVRITGYASPRDYRHWLAAADVAVQLRQNSRGETSGTVLDCLAHGLALIVNAHGSMADLPADALCMLPDLFEVAELRAALEGLHADPRRRADLGRRGRAAIARVHQPPAIAAAYRDALEDFARQGPHARHRRLLGALGRPPLPADLDALAEPLALRAPAPGPGRWYLDISALRLATQVTGIERVTQTLLMACLDDPALAARVTPVHAAAEGYRESWGYLLEPLGLAPAPAADSLVLPRAGDLFLGLDWAPGAILAQRARLTAWRARGVRLWFLVHDILPATNPEWFPAHVPPVFRAWLDALAQLADGCVCVSAATAAALADWWERQGVAPRPRLRVSHNGADFSAPDRARPADPPPRLEPALERALDARPSLLMVGTIEPRKGHRQVLAAMDRLWSAGLELNLIVVGRAGWPQDSDADRAPIRALVDRLQGHPRHGQRLFWPPRIDDAALAALYRRASALLAASDNEGFGLPLIEAAHHGLALIARDIPVFREVAGTHAWFFPAGPDPDGAQLAASLRDWLSAWRAGQAPTSQGLPIPTWTASAARLRDILLDDLRAPNP